MAAFHHSQIKQNKYYITKPMKYICTCISSDSMCSTMGECKGVVSASLIIYMY